MRIVRVRFKVLYFVIWGIAGFIVGRLDRLILTVPAADILGLCLSTVLLVVAVRTFRGRDEPVDPPRRWWRMTAKPTAGYVLGVLAVLTLINLRDLGYPASLTRVGGPVIVWTSAVLSLLAGIAYLNSSIRLTRMTAAAKPIETTAPTSI